MVIVATITYHHLAALDASQRWVAHAHDVLETSHEIVISLADAGRARRTFAQTRDDAELPQYRTALARVDAARTKLRELLGVEATQDRMDELDQLIASRRAAMDDAIRDERTHPFDPGAEAALSSVAVGLTGRLAKLVGQLDADMQRRLDDRTITMHEESESVERTILFGFGASVIILLSAFFTLRREVQSRERSERWLSTTLLSITDAVVALDERGNVTFTNPAVETQLGLVTADAIGRPLWKGADGDLGTFRSDGTTRVPEDERPIIRALAGETVEQAEIFVRSKGKPDGRWHSVNASPVRDLDGTIRGAVSVSRDVTELRRAMEQLEKAAVRDELTGLLNRRGFQDQAAAAVSLAQRNARSLALVYVDLNGMKLINDTLGHHMGDRALVDVADLLRKTFRASDLIARVGGDEFVVLAPEYSEDNDGAAVRSRFQANLAAMNDPSRPFRLSASLGVTIYNPTERVRTISDLLAEADERMYAIKQRRRAEGTTPIPTSRRA